MARHLREPERKLQILLVEDDPGDILIAQEALRAGQLESALTVVQDGGEALNVLRSEGRRPDLVLLDLNLPGMSGHEVLAEIKGDPALRMHPVVVLSTSGAEEDVRRSYDLGANVYVKKPVDFDRFAEVVKLIEDFFLGVASLP
jgi:two-component system, chemotaxis family, response regulator Rcp1